MFRSLSIRKLRGPQQNGFALIAAMLLLGFLLLLFLSLSLVTQLELSSATLQSQQMQARQNALTGLYVALGQLQASLGPDQRVSAPAGEVDASLAPDDLRRHWVAVLDAARTDSAGSPNPNYAQIRSWLVSGQNTAGQAVPSYQPNVDNAGKPVDATNALLAGPTSVGATRPEDFIIVPKQSLPDASHYAYWVSDESFKASLALYDTAQQENVTKPNAALAIPEIMQKRMRHSSPVTQGIAVLPGFNNWTVTPDADASLERLLARNDVAASGVSLSGGVTVDWDSALEGSVHDTTLSTVTLQTDTANGGLKKDLNLLFELDDAEFGNTPYAGNPESARSDNPPTDGWYRDAYTGDGVSFLFKENAPQRGANAFVRGPTWHYLRDYYRLYQDIRQPLESTSIDARAWEPNTKRFGDSQLGFVTTHYASTGDISPPNDGMINEHVSVGWGSNKQTVPIRRLTGHEVAPLLNRCILVFGFQLVENAPLLRLLRTGSGADPEEIVKDSGGNISVVDGGTGDAIALTVYPILVLWNPYNVAVEFEAYAFRWQGPRLGFTYSWDDSAYPVQGGGTSSGRLTNQGHLDAYMDAASAGQATDYLSFFVRGSGAGNPVQLEPGEFKIFSLQNGQLTHFGDTIGKQPLFLEPGLPLGIQLTGGADFVRTGSKKSDIDTTPASADSVTIDEVIISRSSTYEAVTGPSCWHFMSDYLLTYAESSTGGNLGTTDSQLHEITAYHVPPGGDIQEEVKNIRNLTISTADILNNGGNYPFLMVELQMKPTQGASYPVELLGNSNPLGILMSQSVVNDLSKPFYDMRCVELGGSANAYLPEADDSAERAYFGRSYASGDTESTTHAVIAEVPTAPLWSLGSLQHVNASADSAFMPINAIGNSRASPYIDSSLKVDSRGWKRMSLYDVSYLSNEALFDSFFFSSLGPLGAYDSTGGVSGTVADQLDQMKSGAVSTGGAPTLPNPRMTYLGESGDFPAASDALAQADGYLKSAAFWGVGGGFNVNSTSVEAWRAVLSSQLGVDYSYLDTAGQLKTDGQTAEGDTLFSRGLLPNAQPGDHWKGPRSLSSNEIDALAEAIVTEVKERGPFLSLAGFVNRDPDSSNVEHRRQGALAAAIERAGLNDGLASSSFCDDAYVSGTGGDFIRANTVGVTAAGIPGWLTQADLLTQLAPSLTVRGDTFSIRAYGDVTNPYTGKAVAQAWCEAVVQRYPAYVDADGNAPFDDIGALNNTNQELGRAFRIVSFRWLSKDEI